LVSWRRSLTGWAPRASLTCARPSLTSSGRRPRTAGKRTCIRLGVRTRVLSVDRMTRWSTSSSVARDLPSKVGKFGRRRHAPSPSAWLPLRDPPPGCTERVRQYLRNYLTIASNLQIDEQGPVLDCDALALWLARPPSHLLSRLDVQLGSVVLSSPELAYLRKELISILCRLLIGTRYLWRLRCAGAFEQSTESTAMTCSRLTPKVSSSSQRTVSSYFPSLPFSLSLDPPLLDSQLGGPLGLQGSRSSQPSQAPRLARGFPFYLRCPLFPLLFPLPARPRALEGGVLAALRPRRHRVSSPSWKRARMGPPPRHLFRLRLHLLPALSPRPRPRTRSTPFLTFLACRT
jgi:hypothetical protein